jgi:hypothetical protein
MAKSKSRSSKPSLKQLTAGTHKGRAVGAPNMSTPAIMGGAGVSGSQIRNADPRLTAAALTAVSPTPTGPEPHWPYGA